MDNVKQVPQSQEKTTEKRKLKWWGILLIVLGSVLAVSLIVGTILYFVFQNIYTNAFYNEEVQFVERTDEYVEETIDAEELDYVPYELVVEVPNTTYFQNESVDKDGIIVKIRYFDGEKTVDTQTERWWMSGSINDTIKNIGEGEMTVNCTVVIAGIGVRAKVVVPIEVVAKTSDDQARPTGKSFSGTGEFDSYPGAYHIDPLSVYSEETLEAIKYGFINYPIYKKEQINKDIMNFLIIGSGNTDDGRYIDHAETIIVVSYNKKNNTLKAISLLRDMLVPIEGYGWNKLQVAYRIGGPGLLINTINDVYGLDIQYYVRTDIDQLVSLIDTLGGVELDVTQENIDSLELKDLNPGKCLLTGDNLYNWIVYNGSGSADISRTARQSRVVKQLLLDYATGEKSIMHLVNVCTENQYIITNMPFSKLVSNLYSMVANLMDIEYSHCNLPELLGDPYDYVCYKEAVCGINIPTAVLKKMMAEIIG